ncbi:MAG: WYL domain-containing protein [Clostridia bacterium]|nr:WYL domain-containing protein [Clostridia bacterium]
MAGLEPKKLALLRIWQILQKHSDYDHPLTQEDIIKYLKKDYGIEMERKAVGKNIADLRDAGIDIGSRRAGSYIDSREFEDSELRLLIDGVLQSKHITAKHSKDLIERLCGLSNKYFRSHVKNVYSVNDWSKTENQAIFYNIDVIDEAIASCKQVQYDYNKYGVDAKLHRSSFQRVSPYQLILHNQRYYLMGYSDYWGNMTFHRLDHITNMRIYDKPATPITSVKGYENGLDFKKIASAMPYMYTDTPERIVFIADEYIVDQIVDWFGKDIKMSVLPDNDKKVQVELIASPNAMEYWALQYLNHVEVTKPERLRKRISESLKKAMLIYSIKSRY